MSISISSGTGLSVAFKLYMFKCLDLCHCFCCLAGGMHLNVYCTEIMKGRDRHTDTAFYPKL